MAEIGATLREARMRNRIDIHEVETATKIRAKYLRALENEEWDLLPGPTYVKTFLRTYADYLGLDSRMLVEEYKQRFERPGPQDLLPFSTRAGGRRPPRRSAAVPPFAIVVVFVALLLGALYAVGKLGSGSGDSTAARSTPTATPVATPARSGAAKRRRHHRAVPTHVALRIIPTGTVNVCLVNGASGKVLIRSQNLTVGQTTQVFRARRLKVTFGNGLARMRTGGHTYQVPAVSEPIGYLLRPGHKPTVLSAAARPTCG